MNGHSVLKPGAAQRSGEASLVERSVPSQAADAFALAERAHALHQRFFLWQSQDRRRTVFGAGETLRWTAEGQGRFAAISEGWRGVSLAAAPTAMLLGGFSFADRSPRGAFQGMQAADFFVPRVLLQVEDGKARMSLFAREGGEALEQSRRLLEALSSHQPLPFSPSRLCNPPGARAAFERRVLDATRSIAGGDMAKVVLARYRLAVFQGPPAIAAMLGRLSANEADCRIFAFGDGQRVFLGATPELLVRLSGGIAAVDCLAGSAPRSADPATDRALGQELLTSPKNRREHDHVVSAVRDTLGGLGLQAQIPDRPQLRVLAHVQHLYTPVRASLTKDLDLFRVAGALHPTPAVGGSPRDAALAWILGHEGMERGFYAGAVGFSDAAGQGELDVALRSALIRGRNARLYAGNGIVAGSDPSEEFYETEFKMRPLTAALREAR